MMQRLAFILLLALLAIIQCGATVESSNSRLLRKTSRPTKKLDFGSITYSQQQPQYHRELSSSSSGGTWFAWMWYNALTHLCPPHHEHCPHPCPPGKPDCHHHSSSSSSSGGDSGGNTASSSSGGGSSSGGSSGGDSSYSNNGDGEYNNNDGWSADGHDSNYSGDVDYMNGDDSTTWSDDGWNSSNLDNGNANGSTFEVNAQSIVPFLVGALVAGVIGAAFVVSRNRRKAEEEAHPLEGSLKKRMKLFSGGVFRKKKGMLDDEVGEDGDARSPAFVEIASVGDARSVRSGAGIYEAPNVSNVVSGFDNEDDSDLDSEM